MTILQQDLAYTFRRLLRTPGFAIAVIVSIGLGIAANATIFSMVSRFVLRPAPVGDPASLLALHTTHDGDQCCNNFPKPVFEDVRDQAQSFSGVSAYDELVPASVGGKGEPERVWGQAVSANFFDVLQLPMIAGRGFLRQEENQQVIVLSHRLWQRRFASDSNIAGKVVTVSGHPYTVVGVAPAGFRGIDLILDSEFWVPLGNVTSLVPNITNNDARDQHWLQVVARLKPGVTRIQADAELGALAKRLAVAYPATDKGNGFLSDQAGSLPPRDRSTVLLFLGALSVVVLLVLCIACANVANLMLSRAASRQREMAVRLALGATRLRIIRQMVLESVLLALMGGAFGTLLSLWATQALATFHFPAPVPVNLTLNIDWRVLAYTFALSVGAGLFFGIVPAWATLRPMVSNALKGEDALARPGRKFTMRNVLIVGQIAMCLVLLTATGLFLRSLQQAANINIGFRSDGIVSAQVDPRVNGYTADARYSSSPSSVRTLPLNPVSYQPSSPTACRSTEAIAAMDFVRRSSPSPASQDLPSQNRSSKCIWLLPAILQRWEFRGSQGATSVTNLRRARRSPLSIRSSWRKSLAARIRSVKALSTAMSSTRSSV